MKNGEKLRTLKGHSEAIRSIALSSDSKIIVSAGYDKMIKIWNLESGEELRTLAGHTDKVSSVAISSKRKFIISGSFDKSVKIWNYENCGPHLRFIRS